MDKVTIGDLITLDDGDYLVLDMQTYNGIEYAFTNKIAENEQPTKEFYTYEVEGDEVTLVDDEGMLNILLPMFSKNIQKLLDSVEKNS